MARSTFGDLYADFVAKSPQRAARTLADLRRRHAELVAGAAPRYRTDTVEAVAHQIASYLAGFRTAARCEARGCPLEDPVSVWRGYGPDCWARLTDDERAAVTADAERRLGPCPRTRTRATAPARTVDAGERF